MTSAEMITAALLKKKAVVHVRQSTQSQVMTALDHRALQEKLLALRAATTEDLP